MEVKVIQNWRGKYYLGSNEEQLSLVVGIYDENNKIIEVDGVKAMLQLIDDIEPFESPLDEITEVYNACWKYASTTISSTNYEAQCLAFAKVFNDNYEKLCKNRIEKQKVEVNQEIERLQNKLKYLYGFDEITWDVNNNLNKEINKYSKWLESAENELVQIKEGTDKYNDVLRRVEIYKGKLEKYNNSKITDDEMA